MHDRRKTKKELRAELANLRQRVAVLESNGSPSRADRGRAAADRDRPDDSPWQSPSVAASNGALLERLRDSEERFRLAFEHSPLGMSILDLEGRYQKVNRAWCRMMGYAAEEVLGKPVGFLAHPDDHHRWWGETQDVLHGKRPPLTAEVRYRTKAERFSGHGSRGP